MKPNIKEKIFKATVLCVLAVTGLMYFSYALRAQGNREKFLKMIEEDRTTIDAVAGADEAVRQNILVLSRTPEVLDVIQDLQKKSERKFRDIIIDYDRDEQAALYDMARYPDLISELVRNGKPSSSEVNGIVQRYPSDIRETARKNARNCYSALREIDVLNNETDRQFQSYLSPYDEDTRASVNVLLKYPEIVSILVEDKDFTAELGIVYREDPGWVSDQLNIISRELDEQNKKDLSEYQNQMENDPEAYQEMLSSAEQFARETNNSRGYETEVDPDIEIRVINSYPFWYGYPYWYPYPYWRPYPVYYHTGFYFGPQRNIIFIGLPSNHFIYWHTHYHPTLYPHLSYGYYNYYQRHYLPYRNQLHRPVSHYAFYHSVERNVVNNPRVNNDNLVRIDRNRGNNIIRRPNSIPASEQRRGSAAVRYRDESRGNILRSNSSVRRDAFPKTSPSSVETRGTRQRPAFSGSASSVKREYRRPSISEGQLKNSPIRKGTTKVSPLRNYKNYKAAKPRQVKPSFGRRESRSVPQKISPQSNRSQASQGKAQRLSGGRTNRNSK